MTNNKKGNGSKLLYKLRDRLLLVCTALVVGLSLFFFNLFLDKNNVPKEWTPFIAGSFAYSLGVVYGVFKFTSIKEYPKRIIPLLMLIAIVLFPIVAIFLLFYFAVIPLPDSALPIMIGNLLVVPAAVIFFELCLQHLNKRR